MSGQAVGGLRFLLEAAIAVDESPRPGNQARAGGVAARPPAPQKGARPRRPHERIRWSDEPPPLPAHLYGVRLRPPMCGRAGSGDGGAAAMAVERRRRKRRAPGAPREEEEDPMLRRAQAEGHRGAGDLCMERGEWETAEQAYGEALRLAPELIDARGGRAGARMQLGMLPGALEDALQCVLCNPHDARNWARASEVQRSMGMLDIARHSLLQAMSLDPQWDAALLALRPSRRPAPPAPAPSHLPHLPLPPWSQPHVTRVTAAGDGPSPTIALPIEQGRAAQQQEGSKRQRVAEREEEERRRKGSTDGNGARSVRISKDEMRRLMLEALQCLHHYQHQQRCRPQHDDKGCCQVTLDGERGQQQRVEKKDEASGAPEDDDQQQQAGGLLYLLERHANDPGVQQRAAFARHLSLDPHILDDLYSQGHAADLCRNPACSSLLSSSAPPAASSSNHHHSSKPSQQQQAEGGQPGGGLPSPPGPPSLGALHSTASSNGSGVGGSGCVDFQTFPKDPQVVARWIVTGYCARCLGVEVKL